MDNINPFSPNTNERVPGSGSWAESERVLHGKVLTLNLEFDWRYIGMCHATVKSMLL